MRLVTSAMQMPDEPSVTQRHSGSHTFFFICPIVHFSSSAAVTSRLPFSLDHSELLSESAETRPAFRARLAMLRLTSLLLPLQRS